jgi:hypothetical protein
MPSGEESEGGPEAAEKEKPQVTASESWDFPEPPSGFEPETYALRDPEGSCYLVPGHAAWCCSAWSEHVQLVGLCYVVLRHPKAFGHRDGHRR